MNEKTAVGWSIALLSLLIGCTNTSRQEGSLASLPPAPRTIGEEEITLGTPTGDIGGTVMLPARAFPVPVVLIHAGSGPTDRDGNSALLPGAGNNLKMLAEGLAARGIASLRYDKRGIRQSKGALAREEDIRFDHYIDDAERWIRLLREDARFSTITVAGHSEGSLIGMIAAKRAGADAFVSLAGAGRSPRELITEQLAAQLPPQTVEVAATIMEKVERGQVVDSVPGFLAGLFRPSVQPYLRSWFGYSPTQEIARLNVPVVVIQGTTDLQTKEEDARRLAAARPGSKLVIIEGMNHVLKTVTGTPAEQLPSYSDSGIQIAPRVVEEIAALVSSLRRRR